MGAVRRARLEGGRLAGGVHLPGPGDELCCGECGGPVEALLTVDGGERGSGGGSWTAVELRELVEADPGAYLLAYEPTQIQIGRGCALQFYYCLADPRHRPRMQ
ncbi:hypothetical protein ACFYYN_41800 [Streptomyces sp. NPDC001902]